MYEEWIMDESRMDKECIMNEERINQEETIRMNQGEMKDE